MEKTQVSIVVFDAFTDIDVFLTWDLLNRVKDPDWSVKIIGEKSHHISMNGLTIPTHGFLEEVSSSAAVIFTSGPGARKKIEDNVFLSSFKLNPDQLICSMCSGALILGALGLLNGKLATTYPTAVERLRTFGAIPTEKPFVSLGNIATAAGCLSAQYLVEWIIEKFYGIETARLATKSIQPIGEGLFFSDLETEKRAASARMIKLKVST